MSEQIRDKIFDPLFTTRSRGIGLGLALSRSLAEANRGRLTLAASGGTDACFALEVPCGARRIGRAAAPDALVSVGCGGRRPSVTLPG